MKKTPEQRRVLAVLADGDWHKDPEITRRARISSRDLRMFANKSNLLISCAGPDGGYKLAAKADEDELLHAYRDLRSRSREILNRAASLKDAYL